MRRSEWLRAMWHELGEVRGRRAQASWLFGMAVFAVRAYAPQLAALGVVVGVVGGAVDNFHVLDTVRQSGSHTWIGALAFTIPTALCGLVAALLVFLKHKGGVAAAYAFLALVAVSAVVSVGNMTPVRQFSDDWQRATTDPRAAHHAEERRFNAALGALVAATVLAFLARRSARSR